MQLLMTDLFDEAGKPRRLIDIEREQLTVLWKRCKGNVREIAKILGTNNRQVYRRLFKTGLYTPKNGEYYDYPVLSAKQAGKVQKRTVKQKEYHWT